MRRVVNLFRFRLKTLLIAMAVVSVLFAIFGLYLLPAYQERAIIAEILSDGGRVTTEPRGQYLIRQFVGDRLSQRVVGVTIQHSNISDEGLAKLADLHYIEGVHIQSEAVTDKGLAHLYGLRQLRFVYLIDTKTTPAGIESLQAALPRLQLVHRYGKVNGEYVRLQDDMTRAEQQSWLDP